MKILVLGGDGFVGLNVREALQGSPHEVVIRSRRSGLDLCNLEQTREQLKAIRPDIILNCSAHVGSVHYVYDLAAEILDDNMRMNLNLYKAVAEMCSRAKIINPISNCSYPGDATIQSENEYWNGPVHKSVWSFGNSKRMLLVASQCYEMQHHIRSVNFIVGGVYGPHDYTDPRRTHAMNGMIIRMLQAREAHLATFEIWGTGKPQREWIFVKDLARIMVSAIEAPDSRTDPINIAQNYAPTVKETAELIKEVAGFKGQLVFNTQYQDGALIKRLDNIQFKALYPHITFTQMRTGIAETVHYYEDVLFSTRKPSAHV